MRELMSSDTTQTRDICQITLICPPNARDERSPAESNLYELNVPKARVRADDEMKFLFNLVSNRILVTPYHYCRMQIANHYDLGSSANKEEGHATLLVARY